MGGRRPRDRRDPRRAAESAGVRCAHAARSSLDHAKEPTALRLPERSSSARLKSVGGRMRRRTLIFGGCATLVALGLACSKDFVEEQPIAGDGGFLEDSATTIPPQADTGVKDNPAGTGLGTGLPCDVQAVLEDRC